MNSKFWRRLSLCLSLISTSFAYALPDDRDQPIYVTADTASINDITGITTYTGNVIIKQGSILIEAAHVDIYRAEGDIDKMIAKGEPAHFRQKPQIDEPYTDAWGLHMVYRVDDQLLTITKKAKVIQDKDTFTGNKVVYDIDRSIVDAYGDEKPGSGKGRVNMVIQPKKKKTAQ